MENTPFTLEIPQKEFSTICLGGSIKIYRNRADQPFADDDTFNESKDWNSFDKIEPQYKLLAAKAKAFEKKYPVAWSSDFGYLSPNPYHCGTGLEVSGTFFLEGLSILGESYHIANSINACRFDSRTVEAENVKNCCNIFYVFNKATLGVSETEIIQRAKSLYTELMNYEYNARLILLNEERRILCDCVSRALGTLREVRLLPIAECLKLLSIMRLAATLKVVKNISLTKVINLQLRVIELLNNITSGQCDDDLLFDISENNIKNCGVDMFINISKNLADMMNIIFGCVAYSDKYYV